MTIEQGSVFIDYKRTKHDQFPSPMKEVCWDVGSPIYRASAQLNPRCAFVVKTPLPETATSSCFLLSSQAIKLASFPCLKDPNIDLEPCISITGHLGAKVRELFDFLDYLSMQDGPCAWVVGGSFSCMC